MNIMTYDNGVCWLRIGLSYKVDKRGKLIEL